MNSHDEDRRMTNVITAEPTAPGGWLAAVIPGRLAVVHHPEPDAAFAARLWAALSDPDGIRRVLDDLARNGLTSVPDFVLAEWEESGDAFHGRFIVRGGAGVVVETANASEDITANGVSTWVERLVSGVRGFRVECVPAHPAAGPALPLVEGAAWVSAVSFGSAAGSSGDVSRSSAKRGQAAPMEDLDRTIADLEVTVAGEDAAEPAAQPTPAAEPAPTAEVPAPQEAASPQEAAGPQASTAQVPNETTAYDHLFGATMMRSVEDAAARPEAEDAEVAAEPAPTVIPPLPPATTAASAPEPAMLGDHDGLTVLSGDLKAMRDAVASAPARAEAQPEPEPAGSADDGGFTLQLPDGRTEPIDGMVVVGRAPSVSKMGGGRVPRLVTVDSAEHDISRNHVQLTVEGGTVVVTDLHSRNGTMIALPGKTPQKLRAGEPTSVIAGTVIDLGSGVTLGVVPA